MPVDEIIIMANSLKWGGRCVAGISVRSGAWVRPVSTRPHGELYPFQYRIDGREAELFDVVGFEHEGSTGDPTQPENVLVGDSRWWRTGRVGREEAARALGSHRIEFRLDPPLEGTAKLRPRVEFDLGGETYTLSMTDTAVRPRLLRAGLGRHDPSEVGLGSDGPILLTVSLAEARDGWCTKLVAAAFTLPKGG